MASAQSRSMITTFRSTPCHRPSNINICDRKIRKRDNDTCFLSLHQAVFDLGGSAPFYQDNRISDTACLGKSKLMDTVPDRLHNQFGESNS